MKKTVLLIFTLSLIACNEAGNTTIEKPNAGIKSTIEEFPVVTAYTGDCTDIEGSSPIINAVDRDQWGDAGLDLEAMDLRFDAGDDFFCHVNGGWYNNFVMPEDKTRYSAFTILSDKSEARVKTIIEELAAAASDVATLEGKVAAFYNAFLNTAAIENAGLSSAKAYLNKIAAIDSRADLAVTFATVGFSSPIGGWVDVDSKDTKNHIF